MSVPDLGRTVSMIEKRLPDLGRSLPTVG